MHATCSLMPCNLAQATTSAVLSRCSPWQAVWLRKTRLRVHPLHRTRLLATDALPAVMTSGCTCYAWSWRADVPEKASSVVGYSIVSG